MYKYGTAISERVFRQQHEFDEGFGDLKEDEVHRLIAKKAMEQMNEEKDKAIDRVNGMKEDWGTGVSTRVLIYNALGIPIEKRSQHDSSGRWSAYEPSERIECGEWDVSFHHKKSGSATGSCAAVGYYLKGYGDDDILMVGFETPYSGSNSGHCTVLTTKRWANAGWDQIHEWAEDGPAKGTNSFGRSRTHYSIDQSSSPLLIVVATRSDIGYYD